MQITESKLRSIIKQEYKRMKESSNPFGGNQDTYVGPDIETQMHDELRDIMSRLQENGIAEDKVKTVLINMIDFVIENDKRLGGTYRGPESF